MLRDLIGARLSRTLSVAAGRLASRGIKPNTLTYLGVGLSLATGVTFWRGHWVWGGLILIVAGVFDVFDGALARESDLDTPFGAFLDSTCDRLSDAAIYFGVMSYYVRMGENLFWSIVTVLAFLAAFMTSYTRARAECIVPKCDVGVAGRGERIVMLIAGALFRIMKPMMVLLLLLSTVTVFQRVMFTRKSLQH